MKKPEVKQYQSRNFDERQKPISFIIIHATEANLASSLCWLTDPEKKISAHYVISELGDIYELVDPAKRAWHAGVSAWGEETELNHSSIGIELVHLSPDEGRSPYPGEQLQALYELLDYLTKKYKIPSHQIIAHSDIAPDRKRDPGEEFPWQMLAQRGYGCWANEKPEDNRSLDESEANLRKIGYRLGTTQEKIIAFQRHFMPDHVTGLLNPRTATHLKTIADEMVAYRKKPSYT